MPIEVSDLEEGLLCAYHLEVCRGVDLLDVTRTHQCSVTRLSGALDVLSKPLPGHELLPPRERMVLAGIVRGASNEAILVTTATLQRHVGSP